MPTIEDLKSKVKEIVTLLDGKVSGKGKAKARKQELSIPGPDVAGFLGELDRILQDLCRFVVTHPSREECGKAIKHPLANQIAVFTTFDKKRKAFFSPAYFQGKFESLPIGKEEFLAATGKKSAYREAIIFYYWWNSRNDGFKGLSALWQEIEGDYKNSPEVRRETAASAFVEELMGVADVSETARRLLEAYPAEAELKAFAKLVALKVPPQPRAKGSHKLTAHERLAREIHSQGSVSRLQLD